MNGELVPSAAGGRCSQYAACTSVSWQPVEERQAAHHQCSLQLGQEGKVPLQSAHMYYNVTEKVRRVMESYFRLDTPLYFSYSHLVCRTAIEGRPHGTLRTWRRRGRGPFTLAEKPVQVRRLQPNMLNLAVAWRKIPSTSQGSGSLPGKVVGSLQDRCVSGVHRETGSPASQGDQF